MLIPASDSPRSGNSLRGGRHWLQMILVWITWSVGCVVLAGTLVRLTVKDSLPGIQILFFATPLAVLFAGAAWCMLSSLWQRRFRMAVLWALITAFNTGWWIQQDWRIGHSAPGTHLRESPGWCKVVFWNVARRADLAPAADYLRTLDADIIGLVEVSGNVEQRRRFWQEALPDYDVSILGGQIYLLTKGKSGQTVAITLPGGNSSIARHLQVTIRGSSCDLFLVDFDARPGYSRIPGLKLLSRLVEERKARPVIVMGDFNTPPASVGFGPFRKHLRQSFETAGTGYAPTWPFPVPVLQLDQMWVNSNVEPKSCRHGNSWASDHRPVIAEFVLNR
jgi:endonuclease/exonuclease/phosphatase family metal-dependent hydrolase